MSRSAPTSKALVPFAVVENDRTPAPPPILCGSCGGPPQLCGGLRGTCLGGCLSRRDFAWLTAIRALYAGLVLIPTPGALWGGSLVRLAGQIARAQPRLRPRAAERVGIVAATRAHVGRTPREARAAGALALEYLQGSGIEALHAVFDQLRAAPAPWLVEVRRIGSHAAVASPLEPQDWDLFAVLCESCADEALPLERRIVSVRSYDHALRCPLCGVVSTHPLPGVTTGEPHPVGRCLPTPRKGPPPRCWSHREGELDTEGLCPDGQRIFDAGALEVKGFGAPRTPHQRELVEAFLRAKRWVDARQIDGDALFRQMALSPEFGPFFQGLAAASPEAAKTLEKLTGAPFDVSKADLGVATAVRSRGDMQGVIAGVGAAIGNALAELFGGIRKQTKRALGLPAAPARASAKKTTRKRPARRQETER